MRWDAARMFSLGSAHESKQADSPARQRKISMNPRLIFAGTILLLAPAMTLAQAPQSAPPPTLSQPATRPQNQPQRENPPHISTTTSTVIVPVTVKDSKGQLVGGLTKDDFRVFSDDVEQAIGNFSADPVPLSAVVLIDNDLNDRVQPQVQKSLVSIAAAFGPDDEAALVTYEQFPETVSDFSTDNDLLFTKLKRLELGTHSNQSIVDPTTAGPIINGQPSIGGMGSPPSNGTGIALHGSGRYKNVNALDDAIFAAAEMLKSRGHDRRKIIFIISDGADSRNEHTFDQTLHLLLENDIIVYSISVNRSLPIGRKLAGEKGAAELVKYAYATGGDTYYGSKDPDLERLYSDVTEEARNLYTLTFSPQDIHTTQDYHDVEVRVDHPGLTVDTRGGYYLSATH